MADVIDTEKIRRERFIRNNGRVLRGINVVRTSYVPLADLKYGLPDDLTETEYLDAINYLTEAGYIKIRNKSSKTETTLADTELEMLEAKVSANGIRLLAGKINDDCIRR